jgi:regulator of replication initiation timing
LFVFCSYLVIRSGEKQSKWQLETASLQAQLKQLNASNENLENQLKQVEAQSQQISLSSANTLSRLESQLRTAKEEHDELVLENTTLRNRSAILQSRSEAASNQVSALHEQVADLLIIKQSADLKIAEQTAHIQLLLDTNSSQLERSTAAQLTSNAQLEAQHSILLSETSSLKQSIALLLSENSALKQDITSLRQQAQGDDAKLSQLKADLSDLQRNYATLLEQKNSSELQFETLLADMNATLSLAESQRVADANAVQALESQLAEEKDAVAHLQEAAKNSERQLLERASSEEIEDLRAQLSTQKLAMDLAKAELQLTKDTLVSVSAENTAFQSKAAQLEALAAQQLASYSEAHNDLLSLQQQTEAMLKAEHEAMLEKCAELAALEAAHCASSETAEKMVSYCSNARLVSFLKLPFLQEQTIQTLSATLIEVKKQLAEAEGANAAFGALCFY